MKTLKILVLGALVSITSVSFAQDQQAKSELTPEMKAEKMTKRMTVDLSLTKDQIQKVEAINLEFAKRHESMKVENEQDKEANKAFRAEMDAKYQTVLTPDQMTKMKELEKEKMEAKKAKQTETAPSSTQQTAQPATQQTAQPVMKAQKTEIKEMKPQTIQTEKSAE